MAGCDFDQPLGCPSLITSSERVEADPWLVQLIPLKEKLYLTMCHPLPTAVLRPRASFPSSTGLSSVSQQTGLLVGSVDMQVYGKKNILQFTASLYKSFLK